MSNTSTSPSERPESHQNGHPPVYRPLNLPINPTYLPGGPRSLAGISIRAFGLGISLGISLMLSLYLAFLPSGFWRAPAFISVLSVFHYLEFDMTARYNPPDAQVSSFLLTNNGAAYNIAHTAALVEFCVRYGLRSPLKPEWLSFPFRLPDIFPSIPSWIPLGVGLALILVGQYVRSDAMATAGKSFNHLVQFTKKDDHVLVTTGIYAVLRHPSYFGFFWWGLGTQLLLGNHACFLIYMVVLWKFFAVRIMKEEQFLVQFFGQDYITYRRRTPVLIPFIS